MTHTQRATIRRALTLGCMLVAVVALAACGRVWQGDPGEPVVPVEGGDPVLGRQLVVDYGCIACHSIPGTNRPDTWVGPPLTAWAERRFIAGMVPNEPDWLIQWLITPQSINPQTAMPSVGLDEEDARHIASYLYTLEE